MHTYKEFKGRDKVKIITIWILQLQQKICQGRQASHCPHSPSSKSLRIHLWSEALGTSFAKGERQPTLLTQPAGDLVHLAHPFGQAFIFPFHSSVLFGCFFFSLMQHWQSLNLAFVAMRKHTRKITFLGRQSCESKRHNANEWLWVI